MVMSHLDSIITWLQYYYMVMSHLVTVLLHGHVPSRLVTVLLHGHVPSGQVTVLLHGHVPSSYSIITWSCPI